MLAFGDSLTEGLGAGPGQSYPEVLAELSGLRVINAGLAGELSAEGRERLPALLDHYQPALLLLCHGGNDLLQKKPEMVTDENLRAMIDEAYGRNIPVVLLGVPRPGIFLATADFYQDLATETGAAIVPDIFAQVLADRQLRADTVHPNARGYRLVAEAVHRTLRQTGALTR